MHRTTKLAALLTLALCACETPPLDTDAGSEPGPDATAPACASDRECDDGRYCNGAERCDPGAEGSSADGCVTAVAGPCGDMGCVEDEDRCAERCDTEADTDGDDHRSTGCGGDDCDDSDPLRHPGAVELCDPDARDEDCDPSTFGFRDGDGDTYADARCCNTDDEGTRRCGNDCDDARPSTHAGSVEVCDLEDNDCDTRTDEGVLRTFYVDADADGRGDPDAPLEMACFVPTGRAEIAGDCDDTRATVHTGAPEICDAAMLDEDCDGDANPDALCTCVGSEARSCARPGACAAGTERCSDGAWGACSIAPVAEVCNDIDDDCDGDVDETLRIDCFLDPDDDGWAAGGAMMERLCPVGGRASVGGCAIGYTNRAPLSPALDCAEGVESTHPMARETCNAVDDDCDGATDEGLMRVERYVDRDGDGAEGDPVLRCEGDPNSVAVSRDCNEARTDVYRGAPELCDRIDNNCSLGGAAAGGIDAYEDEDDDGYAPPDALCTGGARPRTDCNDDPAAGGAADHPGATEVCSGRDTDCDGRVDEDPSADLSCTAPGATAGCAGDGSCRVMACDLGRGDCNGAYGDGCEIDLRTSSDHCGGCGLTCGAGASCVDGLCEGITALDAGEFHTCVRFASGTMSCAGDNRSVQLGDGTRVDRSSFVRVVGLSGTTGASLGHGHSCAIVAGGGVRCWGENQHGRLGDGTTTERSTPVAVVGLAGPAVELALGFDFSCARLASGAVQCWGNNDQGQLGDGSTAVSARPVSVVGISNAVSIAADSRHACAVLADGTARCWGNGDQGALGDGGTMRSSVPVAVVGLTSAVQIGVGFVHACARRGDGSVMCWGTTQNGRLGDGTSSSGVSRTATLVSGLTDATHVTVGTFHACARRAAGTVVCWGQNDYGQLGTGSTTSVSTPTPVPGQTGVLEIHAGSRHTCVRKDGEQMACWGENVDGQLVIGTTVSSLSPAETPGLRRVAEVAGYETFACARRTSGTLACWGENGYGQLAGGSVGGQSLRPRVVPSLVATSIDTAAELGCAVEPAGTLACWGRLASGATGVPTRVAGLDDALVFRAAYSHQCVVRESGEIGCWGTNGSGEVGDGTTTTASAPVWLARPTSVHRAALGRAHSCALRRDGRVFCWGANSFGQLGTGAIGGSRRTPQQVGFFDDVVDLAAGNNFTCALRATGSVACWGRLYVGSATSTYATPVVVSGLPTERVVALDAADGGSVCALYASGRLYCWGSDNSQGQMGVGHQLPLGTPTQVLVHTDFSSVMTAPLFTCASRDQRRALSCWGVGGRLGDGGSTSSSVPVPVVDFP